MGGWGWGWGSGLYRGSGEGYKRNKNTFRNDKIKDI